MLKGLHLFIMNVMDSDWVALDGTGKHCAGAVKIPEISPMP